ncbi:hypothetical protein FB157_108195 [Streptomyces sp. BK340]|nr:hypothetical protein FB157_108195 [Streptomyces sp. BK340]
MTTRLEALPHRHVLTLPAMPSAVRTARQTAEQALTEWGINLHHPSVGPALLILSERAAHRKAPTRTEPRSRTGHPSHP